jgi:cytidylate kinase
MYRAVTWAALQKGLDITNEAAMTALAQRIKIEVVPPEQDDGRQYTVLVDGEDITWDIRGSKVEAGVSVVSTYPGVRETLVMQQRRISAQGRVVMVGRDIGTIVLPSAELKIYLDARVNERARRRFRELVHRGQNADYEDVLDAMQRRDTIDSGRQVAPLQPANDAIVIDTSDMTIDQVLAAVEQLVCEYVN